MLVLWGAVAPGQGCWASGGAVAPPSHRLAAAASSLHGGGRDDFVHIKSRSWNQNNRLSVPVSGTSRGPQTLPGGGRLGGGGLMGNLNGNQRAEKVRGTNTPAAGASRFHTNRQTRRRIFTHPKGHKVSNVRLVYAHVNASAGR